MKYKVLKGGLTCQAINPYNRYDDTEVINWIKFDKANPILPLTHQQDEGIEVEGELVWQYDDFSYIDNLPVWRTVDKDKFKNFAEFDKQFMMPTRIALQPITTNSKEERPKYTIDGEPCTEKQYFDTKYVGAFLEGQGIAEIISPLPIASASIETDRISEFKRILNEHFEPDSQTPLFACIALSCDEKEILSLMDKAAHWQSQTTKQNKQGVGVVDTTIIDIAVKDYYNKLHSWEDSNPFKLIEFIKSTLKK